MNGAQFNWLIGNSLLDSKCTVIGGWFLVCAWWLRFWSGLWESQHSATRSQSGNIWPVSMSNTHNWVVLQGMLTILLSIGEQCFQKVTCWNDMGAPGSPQPYVVGGGTCCWNSTFPDKTCQHFDAHNVFEDALDLRHHSLRQVIPNSGGMRRSNTNPTGSIVRSSFDLWMYLVPVKGIHKSIGGPKYRAGGTSCLKAELKPGKPGCQLDQHPAQECGGGNT